MDVAPPRLPSRRCERVRSDVLRRGPHASRHFGTPRLHVGRHLPRRSSPQAVELLPATQVRRHDGADAERRDREGECALVEIGREHVKVLGGRLARDEEIRAVQGHDARRLERRRRAPHAARALNAMAVRDVQLQWHGPEHGRVRHEAFLAVRRRRRADRPARVEKLLVQREHLARVKGKHELAGRDALRRLREGHRFDLGADEEGRREREGRARLEGGARAQRRRVGA
mmetsp:Transcript_18987/g.59188  ORF Transcript_18987/g.59188 Transcript_18987/m.59188 type:complete len:229 (-) Transcript_18987:558-1244(-)